MAEVWRRWRGAFLGGIAVWLMTFPLLLSHPAAAAAPTVHVARAAGVAAGDRALLRKLGQRQQLALASSRIIAADVPSPTPDSVAPAMAPARVAVAPRPAPAVHANNIVIPRLGLNQPVGWYSDCLGRAAVPRG